MLQPDDLPGYQRFDDGARVATEGSSGPRTDPVRFGRISGWGSRYRPADPGERDGPLVVESKVDVFPGEDEARQDLAAYRREFEGTAAGVEGQVRALAGLGDEAVAVTFRQAAQPDPVRFHLIAWREGAVTASVSVQGFEPLTFETALDLARAQRARIERLLEPS